MSIWKFPTHREIRNDLSGKGPNGRFFAPDKLQNYTINGKEMEKKSEEKGKKAMYGCSLN